MNPSSPTSNGGSSDPRSNFSGSGSGTTTTPSSSSSSSTLPHLLLPPSNTDQDPEELEYIHLLDTSHKKLWLSFQNTAASITKLYRDGSSQNQSDLWQSFQASAGTLTQFYKDTIESIGKIQDKGVTVGYNRHRRESLANFNTWSRSPSRRKTAAATAVLSSSSSQREVPSGPVVEMAKEDILLDGGYHPHHHHLHNGSQQPHLLSSDQNSHHQAVQNQQQHHHHQPQQQLFTSSQSCDLFGDSCPAPTSRTLKRRMPTEDIFESICMKRTKPS